MKTLINLFKAFLGICVVIAAVRGADAHVAGDYIKAIEAFVIGIFLLLCLDIIDTE